MTDFDPATHAQRADVERCIACVEPMLIGQRYYADVSGGWLHSDCAGPEREGFCDLGTGEPLGPDEPIPDPAIW